MINLKNLNKKYFASDIETTAINELSLTINKGDFVAIMGHSGCGKSTLMNVLGLLDKPSSGSYMFQEQETISLTEKQYTQLRKKKIGFIFQSFNLIDELTIFENVELPLLYNKVSSAERKERVEEVLKSLNIEHRKSHYPRQLSGGQQQRVAIARAIVNSPELILADEPTGNLDSTNRAEVLQILKSLNQSGSTIVMVTHSKEDAEFANRIVTLSDGQVVAES
ncbi:ABC transporter ATP-binding protein [Pseudoalteromonas piscicida]|uniref:ABC transporter ATP-binding protein n=1 Tax=Pseudoalteromonas piscicida TaxID=43662 RepID=UPI0030A5D860